MPSTTPGHFIATELIDAKRNGRQFKQPDLAAFIDVNLEAWCQANGYQLVKASETAIPAPLKPELSPAEAIYAAYPRKVGKTDAIRAIKKALSAFNKEHATRTQPAHLSLLAITQQFAAAVALWPAGEREFVPYPATWFNRGSYNDDPKEWQRGEQASPTKARDYSKFQ